MHEPASDGTQAGESRGTPASRTPSRRAKARQRSRAAPGTPAPSRKVRRAMSAGGVVYRERDGHVEIVLVARPRQGLWALPKGTPEPGESVHQTAIREVAEETGLEVVIAREIGAIHYRYAIPSQDVLVDKVVHHYLMDPIGGDVALHDHEYDVVDWVDIHEAVGRMSYANERHIVEKAGALIAAMRDSDALIRESLPEAGA